MKNLRGINLNLLPILRELLRKRNVTHAADALNMSQPAVSDALRRLRLILHDQLLIRQGREFVRTAYAERLSSRLESILDEVESLVIPDGFDPSTSKRTVKISTVDYVVFLVGPRLTQKLSEVAPNITLEFKHISRNSERDLHMGDIDFIICPKRFMTLDLEEFADMQMFTDEICCIADENHVDGDLVDEDGNLAHQAVFAHVGITDHYQSFAKYYLDEIGIKVPRELKVPNFLVVPYMINDTDNIAFVQKRLVSQFLEMGNIKVIDSLIDFPRLRVMGFWNNSKNHDPCHIWLRSILREVGEEIDSLPLSPDPLRRSESPTARKAAG